MGNENDIMASSGVTLEQWQKDIASMTGDISKLESRAEAASDKMAKLGKALKVGAVAAGLGTVISKLAEGGRDASELTRTLVKLDKTGFTEGPETGARKMKGALLDVLGAVDSTIGKIPILGQVWSAITFPITANLKFNQEMRNTDILVGQQASGVDELAKKYHDLNERRNVVANRSTMFVYKGDEKKAQELANIDIERAGTLNQITAAIQKQSVAANALVAGSERKSKLAQIEAQAQKDIADAHERAKDSNGDIIGGRSVVLAQEKKAIRERADAKKKEVESQESIAKIEIGAAHETLETKLDGLNGAEEAARIGLEAALKEQEISGHLTTEAKRIADLKVHAAEREVDLAVRARKEAQLAVEQQAAVNDAQMEIFTAQIASDKAALDAATKKKNLFQPGTISYDTAKNEEDSARNKLSVDLESLNVGARQAALDTSTLDAKLAGNKMLSDLAASQASYQERIRKAQFEGNDALAVQLAKQQALNELDIRARQYRITPNEKREARKEQEAQDRAIRHINAMEKNNPNSVAADGRNHVSAATQKARAEYAARHAGNLPKLDKNTIQAMNVQNLVATVVRAATITPGG